MKLGALALVASAAAVTAAVVIPNLDRSAQVSTSLTPAPTAPTPRADPTPTPEATPAPDPVAVGEPVATRAPATAPATAPPPRSRRERTAEGTKITVIEGENAEGCDGSVEDEEEEEEALEDCR